MTESRYDLYQAISLESLDISKNVVTYNSDYKQDVIDLDKHISGEDRSQHLDTFLQDSFVYLKKDKIEGVYFPTFGDGLIVAITPKAGQELMKQRFEKFKMASFPQANTHAQDFMKFHGYAPIATPARMHFGKSMHWKPEGLFNRVGGNIG